MYSVYDFINLEAEPFWENKRVLL